MKLVSTLIVAVLAGLSGVFLGRNVVGGAPQAGPATPAARAELAAALARGEERLAELAATGPALASAPAPSRGGPTEEELEAALARWEASRPVAEAPEQPERSHVLPNGVDLATVPIESLVAELADSSFGDKERQELFQTLRELGRIDEYVAEVERQAAANPEDVGLQIALGHAYLQKLFGLEGSPEVGAIAWKADQAFDRALVLDENNWGARFSKAVALSNWPAFLGRGSEAIEHFELLIEQQESLPDQPHFALPYLYLGNMLQASGQQKEAIEAWKDGLESFPGNVALLAALAAAGVR